MGQQSTKPVTQISKPQTIGIIGVGLMGHGIAINVQKQGWDIGFLDHSGNQPTDDIENAGASKHSSLAELASSSNVIILCVTGTPQIEAIMAGEGGLLANIKSGTFIIDCSTAIPSSTIALAKQVEEAGGTMLDAPMTRTAKEAAEGKLNLIVGGDKNGFEYVRPLLEAFAENISYAGASGAGHKMKLLHNYVSLGFLAVLGEAAASAKRGNVDPAVFTKILASGGGASVALERMKPFILEGDNTGLQFSIANACKDIGYYLQMAEDLGATTNGAEGLIATYKDALAKSSDEAYVPEIVEILSK
ncbi:MAG: NAD(P)-dependent oxidoreductase [Rhizobiaceae bacterium]|nr:NAD(P)-dependent oxidoreductase [Rhizobiaceae bacterium]